MNIFAKRGDQVRFLGASDCQVTYRGNDDPRLLLSVGEAYTVHHTDVSNWHTDAYLVGFPGKRFNSVCFEDAPRGSRMPDHLPSIDPLFADAAFRPFSPEEKKMVAEKVVERARRAGL